MFSNARQASDVSDNVAQQGNAEVCVLVSPAPTARPERVRAVIDTVGRKKSTGKISQRKRWVSPERVERGVCHLIVMSINNGGGVGRQMPAGDDGVGFFGVGQFEGKVLVDVRT